MSKKQPFVEIVVPVKPGLYWVRTDKDGRIYDGMALLYGIFPFLRVNMTVPLGDVIENCYPGREGVKDKDFGIWEWGPMIPDPEDREYPMPTKPGNYLVRTRSSDKFRAIAYTYNPGIFMQAIVSDLVDCMRHGNCNVEEVIEAWGPELISPKR